MGECGPTATMTIMLLRAVGYSRWGNAGQLQRKIRLYTDVKVIADGGMRANCNQDSGVSKSAAVIADGGMRANCNRPAKPARVSVVIADGGMRANCN